jgi:hypothetical protein
MSDQPQHPGRPDSDDIAGSRLVPQVGMMLKAFWASPIRNTLLWLAGVIFLVVVSTAYGQSGSTAGTSLLARGAGPPRLPKEFPLDSLYNVR